MRIFKFEDGIFSFHTAMYGSWNLDRRIVFRVRLDSSPRLRVEEKNIKYYDCIVPSSQFEIDLWHKNHPLIKGGKEIFEGS